MAAFPTLSRQPAFPLDPDGEAEDIAHRGPFDSGHAMSRPKATRARQRWGLSYILQDVDMSALRSFEHVTVQDGALSFDWDHPTLGEYENVVTDDGELLTTDDEIQLITSGLPTYSVRFAAPVSYIYISPGLWRVEFTLMEA